MTTFRPDEKNHATREGDLADDFDVANFTPIPLPPFVQTEAISGRKESPIALNKLREGIPYTWQDHYDTVTGAGHEWCSLSRDLYTCHGNTYSEVLKRTPPFDVKRFGLLETLPPGSKVLLHGNSLTFELILPVMCALGTRGYGYKLDPFSNTFLIFSDQEVDKDTIVLLLVDNHRAYAWGKKDTAQLLVDVLTDQHPWFTPTHIIAGIINRSIPPGQHQGVKYYNACKHRRDVFQKAWPSATVVNRCDIETGRLGCSCASDDHNCEYVCGIRPGKHQCLPGPDTVASAQALMHDLMLPSDGGLQQQDKKVNAPAATTE